MADRKIFLPFDNSMLPALRKGDTGNEGRKEFRVPAPETEPAFIQVQTFGIRPIPQYCKKKVFVTNSQRHSEKLLLRGKMDLAMKIQLETLTCCQMHFQRDLRLGAVKA